MSRVVTIWRLREVPERPNLKLTLIVDTTAPAVIKAIEEAAEKHGIKIAREA